MIARLSTLLVAGGMLLAESPSALATSDVQVDSLQLKQVRVLKGARLDSIADRSVSLVLDLPGFDAIPEVQVLSHPDRVVVDLPGVLKEWDGKGVLSHPLIQKKRIAQFSTSPRPVTRVVLEVMPGTQVQVRRGTDRVTLDLEGGHETITARLQAESADVLPGQASAPVVGDLQVAVLTTNHSAPQLEALPVVKEAGDPMAVPMTPKRPTLPLTGIPSIGMPFQSLPALAVNALLPASPSEKSVQQPVAAQDQARTSRVLGNVQNKYTGARISIDQSNMDLSQYLRVLSTAANMGLVCDPEVKGIIVDVSFKETPWDQILDTVLKQNKLGKVIENGVIRVAKMDTLKKEEEDLKNLEEAKALSGELRTKTFPLSFAKVDEAKTVVEQILTKRGKLFVDTRTNTLFITDLPKNLPVVEELLNTLDVAPQQVLIEARVVEANIGFTQEMGVKWPTANGGSANLKVGSDDAKWVSVNNPSWNGSTTGDTNGRAGLIGWSGGKEGVTSLGAPAGEAWLGILTNKFNINVILQAAESQGKAKIVSKPRVVCFNNVEGTVLSGEKIPYPVVQAGQNSGAVTVQFMDANLEMKVTPQITSDGSIIMELTVTKSEADFGRQVNGTPTLLNKLVKTRVMVKNGGTAVLGGVFINRTSNDSAGVPYLSKLPVLGGLFRKRSNTDGQRELLVFVTPSITKSN